MRRYEKTNKIRNASQEYRDLLDRKKIKIINQYSTFDFNRLKDVDLYKFDIIQHTVAPFERLYNISYKYYASASYGWLICYTNKISNELDIKVGDVINIYLPLENLLGLM